MWRSGMLRAAAMLAMAGMITAAQPAEAEDAEWYCIKACAAATGASGYFGENALAYFAGCLLGCSARNLQ